MNAWPYADLDRRSIVAAELSTSSCAPAVGSCYEMVLAEVYPPRCTTSLVNFLHSY